MWFWNYPRLVQKMHGWAMWLRWGLFLIAKFSFLLLLSWINILDEATWNQWLELLQTLSLCFFNSRNLVGLFLKIDISYACIYNSTFIDNPLKWLEPQFLENERINTWHLTWLYKWWKAKIFFIYQQSFICLGF